MSDISEVNRRKFLKTGAIAVAGLTALKFGAREAIAHARLTGKVLLRTSDLNALLSDYYKSGRIKSVAREINSDIAGWIRRQCSLTSEQDKRLTSISKSQWAEISRVLRVVEEHGSEISVDISDPSGVFKHHAAPVACIATVKTTTTNSDGTTTTTKGTIAATTSWCAMFGVA